MIRLSFCNLLIHVGFPEFVKSGMYAGVGVPNETDLRLYACLGFLLGREYKVSHSHQCTFWIHSGMKEVLVSCNLNNRIINYLLSSFWVLIFCDQIWLFLLLLQKWEWTLKPRFEDFHPEDGGSRFFQTVANHLPDDTVTGLRRPKTNLCVNEDLFCHVIPSLSTVSSVTHYPEQWQHKLYDMADKSTFSPKIQLMISSYDR